MPLTFRLVPAAPNRKRKPAQAGAPRGRSWRRVARGQLHSMQSAASRPLQQWGETGLGQCPTNSMPGCTRGGAAKPGRKAPEPPLEPDRIGWQGAQAAAQPRGPRSPSSRLISLPVVVADFEGERYLVAMLGEGVHWVANVRTAGGPAVLRHGRRGPDVCRRGWLSADPLGAALDPQRGGHRSRSARRPELGGRSLPGCGSQRGDDRRGQRDARGCRVAGPRDYRCAYKLVR
jgi:hypothetical protein